MYSKTLLIQINWGSKLFGSVKVWIKPCTHKVTYFILVYYSCGVNGFVRFSIQNNLGFMNKTYHEGFIWGSWKIFKNFSFSMAVWIKQSSD